MILELEGTADAPELEPEANLFVRPACFNVVPTSFFTSGTFSLILVLRVPRSVQVFAASAA